MRLKRLPFIFFEVKMHLLDQENVVNCMRLSYWWRTAGGHLNPTVIVQSPHPSSALPCLIQRISVVEMCASRAWGQRWGTYKQVCTYLYLFVLFIHLAVICYVLVIEWYKSESYVEQEMIGTIPLKLLIVEWKRRGSNTMIIIHLIKY